MRRVTKIALLLLLNSCHSAPTKDFVRSQKEAANPISQNELKPCQPDSAGVSECPLEESGSTDTSSPAPTEEKSQNPASKPPSPKSFVLGPSINLGAMFESYDNEGDWGGRNTEKNTYRMAYAKVIADAGFRSVRLPIRWSAHTMADNPFRVDPSFFARIDAVVASLQQAGLTVIIDMHHWGRSTEDKAIFLDPYGKQAQWLALWREIAAHFNQADPKLLAFELLNEPNGGFADNTGIWADYLRQGVSAIRNSGGQNTVRPIIAGPVLWNNPYALDDQFGLLLNQLGSNIISTVHIYEPFCFTHGTRWGDKMDCNWSGSEAEKQNVRAILDKVSAWSKKYQREIFVGEFGPQIQDRALNERLNWLSFMRDEYQQRGFTWSVFDFSSTTWGVFDPSTMQWDTGLLNTVLPTPSVGNSKL